jgi:hypothetical protein
MMKKKVKLEDLNAKGFKVKKGDRPSVNTAMTAVQMGQMLRKLDELLQNHAEMTRTWVSATEKIVSVQALPPAPLKQPNIEVIVPKPENVKKKFKISVVRDQDGFIDYCEIEQM